MLRTLPVVSLFTILTAIAAAQELPAPSLVAPAAPTAASLATAPAEELARGYIAALAALPLTRAARAGQGILTVGIDGTAYQVNAANGDQFIQLMQDRAKIYGDAITSRGSPMIDGQYSLSVGPACKGEKFDPRVIFAGGRAPDGSLVLATSARIIQSGLESDLLVTLVRNRQTIGEIISGTAVENVVIFADVMAHGFSFYGTIKGASIELRLDPEEVKDALGPDAGTDADWQALAACVFTLTKS